MTDTDPFGPQITASALTPALSAAPGAPAVVAFYLPQYHRIPENDEWWGEGFTDWVNVKEARPLYPGHKVPFVPAELGYYDLRNPQVRQRQAELARAFGIYGFCYYFYWFSGRRLLEQPLELMLADGEPSLPFCLCWANEPWTRRWDGRESDVLMPQHHDRVRDLGILDDLMPYLEDPRYIRIDGRPLLLVYRPGLIDDPARCAADLREEAVRRGLTGLFLCNVMSIGDADRLAGGFDAAVEFPPNGTLGRELRPRMLGAEPAFRGKIYDHASVVQTVLARPTLPFPYFPGVMPRWDNTARKGMGAHIFHGSTPELFERWLRRAALITTHCNPEAPLLFVNSWNEWAEGAHLEPDEMVGRRYLEAVRRVVADDPVEPLGPSLSPMRADAGAPAPVSLTSGLPPRCEGAGRQASDGFGWIDSVNGKPLMSHVVSVTRDEAVSMRGWFYGDSREGGRGTARAYLILSAGESVWHAPIEYRHRRPDMIRGIRSTSRKSRKVVRAIDRLPPSLARPVFRLLSWNRDRFGFEIRIRVADLPDGTLNIGMLEVTSLGVRRVASEFRLSRSTSQELELDAPEVLSGNHRYGNHW